MSRSRRRARKRLAEQQPQPLAIDRLSHEGRGIASGLDGKTVFVRDALPGEQVMARVVRIHRQYDEAQTLEVLEPAPQRVDPPCPFTDRCGGCSLQHLDPHAQLAHKQRVLAEQLDHFGGVNPEWWAPPLVARRLGYRSKARLSVRHVVKKETVLVGFREKNGRYVADIEHCPVLIPQVGERLLDLRTLIAGLSVPESIPQIEVIADQNKAGLIFRHLEALTDADRQALFEFGERNQLEIYLQAGGPDTVSGLYTPDQSYGFVLQPQAGIELDFAPGDFTQVNLELNEMMVDQALEWLALRKNDQVLDLFCGLGNFTLPLARQCAHVLGVEGSNEMVEKGMANASRNQIENAAFEQADLHTENLSATGQYQRWAQTRWDAVLLDPPRSGAEEICRGLVAMQPEKILYVSCNPATLARDAGILVKGGYALLRTGVMDMFPHTTHVESMALFGKEH